MITNIGVLYTIIAALIAAASFFGGYVMSSHVHQKMYHKLLHPSKPQGPGQGGQR